MGDSFYDIGEVACQLHVSELGMLFDDVGCLVVGAQQASWSIANPSALVSMGVK